MPETRRRKKGYRARLANFPDEVLGWTDDNPGFVLWYGGDGEEARFGREIEAAEGAVMDQEIGRVAECVSEAIDQSAGNS